MTSLAEAGDAAVKVDIATQADGLSRISGAESFQAKASAIGYAYQFRYALLMAVGKFEEGPDWQLAIEAADDIECNGLNETQLLQLKHRGPGVSLTDASSDLWKTLRIWSTARGRGLGSTYSDRYLLVTTAAVPPGSAASLLMSDGRDPRTALEKLTSTATTSTSQENKVAYTAYLSLSDEIKLDLLSRIEIVPGAPDIEGINRQLHKRASLAVRRDHITSFLERLEGWWFRRCLRQLADPGGQAIQGIEFDSFFSSLRDQLRPNALPVDEDIVRAEYLVEDFEDRAFVEQLKLISINKKRIAFAIRDYLRAFTQRSRWSREGLVFLGEIETYEHRLKEEWEFEFEARCDEIGPVAAEQEKRKAALQIYRWVESANFPIRAGCSERFITFGSLHMLADEMRVGWHPDFVARLMSILEPVEEQS